MPRKFPEKAKFKTIKAAKEWAKFRKKHFVVRRTGKIVTLVRPKKSWRG